MTSYDSNKIRILAVDDEESILNMYQDILGTGKHADVFKEAASMAQDLYGEGSEKVERVQFELVTCLQGEEAVKEVGKSLYEGNPFSVAFIDIRMPPGISGDRVAQKIHALDPYVNIVIVTAYSDVSPQEISKNFQIPGRLFYIQKPFQWNEIYQLAVALSNNWQIYRELKGNFNELQEQLIEQTDKLLNVQNTEQNGAVGDNTLQDQLNMQTQQIEEVNTALRVLLREKERDKQNIQEDIAFNIEEYIAPYLIKLRQLELTDDQEKLVAIIENNLKDVTSAFSSRKAPKLLNFSPMELQVAKLIKHGSTSKEIAETLSLSPLTIESYRRNIRKKIGLTKSKENLRTWLLENL